MGKHGPAKPLWPSVLGLIAATMAIAALLMLVIFYRQWRP